MNRLFIANKPVGISSNKFLISLKKKYNVSKAGYSGTLDPFASGAMIVAFGDFTKLFRFLDKSYKKYNATLWLGVKSDSLDNQNIKEIKSIKPFDINHIKDILNKLIGEISYYPPKYSAKRVGNGLRAYDLAKKGKNVELKMITSKISDIKLLHYYHPFVNFDITISEGGYIRSIAQIISNNLGVNGTLCALHRISEGNLTYQNEIAINPFDHLRISNNEYFGDSKDFYYGKKLDISKFKIQKNGEFLINLGDFYSIIEIKDDKISYILNKVKA